jgi:drug/metabolite transporter (DMT)-like permease
MHPNDTSPADRWGISIFGSDIAGIVHFQGELAALAAALLWAISSVIFVGLGKRMSPLLLNFTKGAIAIILTLLTLWLSRDLNPVSPSLSLGLLVLSGAIGIGIGDTTFFQTLNHLGARRSLLMESLAPPLTAILAATLLSERLELSAWLGILLTVGGVTWVVMERTPAVNQTHLPLWRGIGFGLISALGQASGSVLSRAALADTDISPLWSSLIRLVAGELVMLLWLLSQKQAWSGFQALRSPRFALTLTGVAFAGTYLAIWLKQTALKYTAAGIAQSLTATSPLFVLPIAMILGERVSLRSSLGVVVAIAGVWLLFARE